MPIAIAFEIDHDRVFEGALSELLDRIGLAYLPGATDQQGLATCSVCPRNQFRIYQSAHGIVFANMDFMN
jgi:hypothetical protein